MTSKSSSRHLKEQTQRSRDDTRRRKASSSSKKRKATETKRDRDKSDSRSKKRKTHVRVVDGGNDKSNVREKESLGDDSLAKKPLKTNDLKSIEDVLSSYSKQKSKKPYFNVDRRKGTHASTLKNT